VLRSADQGVTWAENGLQGQQIDAVQTTQDGQHLVAIKDQHSREETLYRSQDGGETWTVLPHPTRRPDAFMLDESGQLFVFHGEGVEYMHPDSLAWQPASAFRPDYSGFGSLLIGPKGHLYVGTLGQGVYRSTSPARTVANERANEVPRHIALGQNYPNPFNPHTTIPFTLAQPARVTMDVVDVLGRVVATLIEGEMPTGMHMVSWEARGIPSGVYFYRLRTEHRLEMRKMILLQ
jgi:hypothetical protein